MSAAGLLPALRDAFSERPIWREFSPHQLCVLLYLYAYTAEPADEFEIAAALPFAIEDFEGAA
jgi:hypothetical protein